MFRFFSILAILIATSTAFSIQAKSLALDFTKIVENPRQCGGQGILDQVRISGCSTQPCIFRPNEDHDFEADFTAGHSGESMNLVVHAVVGGIPNEIINSSINQETQPNEKYTIRMTVRATDELTNVSFVLRAQVYARPGNALHVCGEVNARVN